MLQEDTLKELKSFVSKIYRYKNLSSVNEVQKCMFMSKYEKGKKSLDFWMLPSSQENLKLHIRRANYVATIFNPANMRQMDLVSSLEHGWDENLATLRSDLAFPEDISNILFEGTMRVQMIRAQRNTFQIQVIKKKVRSNILKEFYLKVFDLQNP